MKIVLKIKHQIIWTDSQQALFKLLEWKPPRKYINETVKCVHVSGLTAVRKSLLLTECGQKVW